MNEAILMTLAIAIWSFFLDTPKRIFRSKTAAEASALPLTPFIAAPTDDTPRECPDRSDPVDATAQEPQGGDADWHMIQMVPAAKALLPRRGIRRASNPATDGSNSQVDDIWNN